MKPLFFQAVVGAPTAVAVQRQAAETLRPFNRYLGQAIHTARERQVRYQLRWEPARGLRSIQLRPLDTRLRVPRRRPGVVITNWPEGREPDVSQLAFIPNRGVPVRVTAAERTGSGLRITTEPTLLPTDDLLWCALPCERSLEPPPSPPQTVTDGRGRPLAIAGATAAEDDEHWHVVVAGRHGDTDLTVDGEPVQARALPDFEGVRRVRDRAGASFEVTGDTLRTAVLPAEGCLYAEDGRRFEWDSRGGRQRGYWVQLLPPTEVDADDPMDPRAAFCEGDVTEVSTAISRRDADLYKVKKVDQDRYQLLLDRPPPNGSTLYLPVNLRNLRLQKRALRQLAEAPRPHHRGLLRLCEDPERVAWPAVRPSVPPQWHSLTDETRSGTLEQRDFVSRALGSPDFAFLEGPPGSGKTRAICELVQQLVARDQRVLLCASTHVAIDNVLERLIDARSPIDAVRIGKLDKVDVTVQATQLDERVATLCSQWRDIPAMRAYGDGELREMAERTIIMAANLTCGTTMGIVAHPVFRGRDDDTHDDERPIATMPHWDVLIVDEASKTLIQEFMVPALMARRWVVVGDVRQLPPFADRAEMVANLRDLVDPHDRPVFPRDHQRACLLLFRLLRPDVRQPGMRWLIVEPPGVLDDIERELKAQPAPALAVVRVTARPRAAGAGVATVTVAQLRAGDPAALHAAAADWVLVASDLIADVASLLPGTMLLARELDPTVLPEDNALRLRLAWCLDRARALPRAYWDPRARHAGVTTFAGAQAHEADWLSRHDLAQELAWRLTRLHELRRSRDQTQSERLRKQLDALIPRAATIDEAIAELQDVGLPSILEVLQDGTGGRARIRSALAAGWRASRRSDFDARFTALSFQHRMHPDISALPRELIYEAASLKDANTIAQRDAMVGWSFGSFRARRVWAHLVGMEQDGENRDEVAVMAGITRDFIAWARGRGQPGRDAPDRWEVACLTFYAKQERAISNMLREVTQCDANTRFRPLDAPVEIVCGTIDRFQGREADLVMLSMRNTRRAGFLDSPNRLNVALTRARQQLVIIGNASYFAGCGIEELKQVVQRSERVEPHLVEGWRRRAR